VDSDLPPAALDFITRYIVSIEQLEVLLAVYSEPTRDWSAREINDRLRSQEASILKWLDALVGMRVVNVAGERYRYAPLHEDMNRQIAALADAYRTRRIKVIEVIFSKPNESLLSFMRAFELRKKP
jgi:hypothetical protein